MALPQSDESQLLIRCPTCGQRFKVGEDLRGRMVECGGCDSQFRINDQTIVRARKFYPGEHRDTRLSRFQRVPMVMSSQVPIQTVLYNEVPDPSEFEPTPPLRLIAGTFAVVMMVMIALLLVLGANRGGALDGMSMVNRMMMAGFVGVLGIGLLWYANRKARKKAMIFGGSLAALLLALPLIFTEGSQPLPEEALVDRAAEPPIQSTSSETRLPGLDPKLFDQIGIGPLEAELAKLRREQSSRTAVGLWLHDFRDSSRIVVRDYLLRNLDAGQESHYYPRGDGDMLMVVTGTDRSFNEVVSTVSTLGKVINAWPEAQIVELRMDNSMFDEPPMDKLINRNDPEFYDLNKRELQSIDLNRVANAVRRLSEASPVVYRADITRMLVQLLDKDWVDFKGDVCRALSVWASDPAEAGAAALKSFEAIPQERRAGVPAEMIELIVDARIDAVAPHLDALWAEDPVKWELLYSRVGVAAEPLLIRRFSESSGMLKQSTVRLLGRVGSQGSLTLLESASVGADRELLALIEQSLAAIRQRLGR
jgi:hypothetical protein